MFPSECRTEGDYQYQDVSVGGDEHVLEAEPTSSASTAHFDRSISMLQYGLEC